MTDTTTPTHSQASAIISAGTAAGVTAAPSAPGASGVNSWIPPRKFLAGGLGGIVTWIIIWGLQHWLGFDIVSFAQELGISPDALQADISSVVALALVYVIPPAEADTAKNLNDKIVQAAMADPDSNVSYVQAPVKPPLGEAPVIVPPAIKNT